MPSLGESLRRAREQQGRSLSELAKETCITSRYLAAIEADEPKQVPGEFFYRNYVKQYAKALGLDPDECARAAEAVLAQEDPAATVATVPAQTSPRGASSRGRLLAGAVVCCIALAVIVFIGGTASHRSAQPKPELVDAPHGARPARESRPAPAAAVAPAEAQSRVTVKVEASEPAWVSVSAEGRTLFRGRLQPAETRDFSGVENAKLWTGNAAALNVEWNGKTIGPLGSRGQVALVLFTPETYRILAPRGL